MNPLRLLAGLLALGFIVRYMVNENRTRVARLNAMEHETIETLRPWRGWVTWRQQIIEQEFANASE